ncbi:Arc family DNA-binding protein [Bradyrhizobium symbiodeficiens]|uniref:Arc family DNA-binding protein n=1 Tax=Bradyrhizobium symbiodeficiens TaxID=1404367 RepID=UPI000C77AC95|nr:Arc family DNA-binding protein [Bradyrhizobium symbiodeficiens]AWM07730.1 Arc family DNA-binding protein [Bradyrhizobium symbiodeficiens]
MPGKSADVVQVNVRLPVGLRRKIAADARRNKRSFNAEIVHRLQETSSGPATTTSEDIARLAAMEAVELTLQRLGIEPKQ